MTAGVHTQPEPIAPDEQDEQPQQELFAAIASAHAMHTDPRERPQAILDAIALAIGATWAHLSLTLGSDEQLLESGSKAGGAWAKSTKSAALQVHADATPRARVYGRSNETPELALLAAPLAMASQGPFGGIALIRTVGSAADAERLLVILRAAAAHACLALTSKAPTRHPGAELEDFARVFAKAHEYTSVHEFAYAVTNSLRTRLDCDQTALGITERGRVKLVCISGLDHVKRRSPGAHRIEQAMGESLDAGTPLKAQSTDHWDGQVPSPAPALHRQWRADAAGASVATIPLKAGDDVVAVLSLRRPDDKPFSKDDLANAARLVLPLASALPLIADANRSLTSKAAVQLSETVRWSLRPGSWARKALLILALVFGMWFVAGSSTYRISAPAKVVAMREHAIATPFAGRIGEVLVRPGDRVEAQQPIARMDTRDLEFERREILAQIMQLEGRLKDASNQRDLAGAARLNAERAVFESRQATLEHQLDQAEILSPGNGVIVGSETRELAGAYVFAGEPLFVVADESSLMLELSVPEGRITHVDPGNSIRFASHARPEITGQTALERIAPTADDSSKAFPAHAPIPQDQSWLRPGMEGVAQIHAGKRRNWWIALHGVLDSARLRFWID